MSDRRAERRRERGEVNDLETVLAAAARLLEVRARSVAEVRRRLTGAGYRSDLVDGAIARLVDLGYLDDDAFARGWVESRDRARPRGEHALRRELAMKGIDRSTVDEVLETRASEVGDAGPSADEAAAQRLLDRHGRALARVADARQRRQKAYALLARNGFDPDVCAAAATAFVAGEPPGDPED